MKKINLLIAGLLSLSLNSYAARGGGSADTGGGNAVGGQLLDLFENEGTTPINVTQLKAYQQVVLPILDQADYKTIGVKQTLLDAVKGKVWLLDSKRLSRSACLNSSLIEAAKEVVGCQNNLEVRIYSPWYNKVNITQQAALIIHELLRGMALKSKLGHGAMSDSDVAFATRALMNVDNISDIELAEILDKTNVGNFSARSNYSVVVQNVIIPDYRKICIGQERAPLFTATISLFQANRDGRYNAQQRAAALKMAKNLRHITMTFDSGETSRGIFCKAMNQYIMDYN